jgi:hypothetical protein
MSDLQKYTEIFDYLSAPEVPTDPEATVVFGRKDPLVAHKAGELAIAGLADIIVITGGIGKDSGDILEQGFRSEAHYLSDQLERDARERGYSLPTVLLEEKAKHGGQNAEFSLDMLLSRGDKVDSLTAVAHATSSLRLAETLKFKAQEKTGIVPVVHRAPSAYNFDSSNPSDQHEAAAELLRLADWPAQGMLNEQSDLPENLVDFAHDKHGKAPSQPSPLITAVLSKLPPRLQAKVMRAADRHSKK